MFIRTGVQKCVPLFPPKKRHIHRQNNLNMSRLGFTGLSRSLPASYTLFRKRDNWHCNNFLQRTTARPTSWLGDHTAVHGAGPPKLE